MASTSTIDVLFRTKGQEKLDKLTKRLDLLEREVAKLNRQLPQTANNIRNTGRAAATASGNIQRFGIAFRSTVAPIVAAYGALNFFGRALNVMADRQADVAVLTNGLKNLGISGTAELERLRKAASDLGEQTLFNEEDFTRAFGLLTSFRAIGVSSYERVAKAAADIATVTRTDVSSSMLQLAKALENPVEGMTALSRSGTTFTASQKALVKSLVESGNQLQAQQYILSIVEGQYRNAAKQAATGFAGAMDTLNEAFRDFQEVVGKGVLPIVTEFVKGATDTFRALSKLNPQVLTTAGRIAVLVAKVLLLNKAITSLIALRVAVVGALTATAGGMTATGVAAGRATGMVAALTAAMKRFLPLAAAFAAYGFLDAAAKGGANLEQIQKRLESGGTGKSLLSGGKAQTREAILSAQETARATIKAAEAELKTLAPNGWLSLIPGFGAADAAARGSRAQLLQGRIADAKSILGIDPKQFKTEADLLKESLAGVNAELEKTGGGGGGGSKTKSGESPEEILARQRAEWSGITGQIVLGNQAITERLQDQQMLNRLIAEGFTKEDAAEQVRQAGELRDIEFERARALQELGNIEGIAQKDLAANAKLINQLFDYRIGKLRQINVEQKQATEEAKRQEEIQRRINFQQDILAQAVNGFGQQMAGVLDTLIQGTDNWNQVLTSTLKSLSSMLLKFGLQALGGGDGAGFFSILSGDFKPGKRAKGGPVSSGSPYVVGEKGPEMFVPSRSGTIVPNGAMGGVNSVVNVTINGDGSSEVDSSQGQELGRLINSSVTAILMRERRPGGMLAR